MEPWGFDIDDARLGMLSMTVAASFGGAKKLRADDFMMGPRLPARADSAPIEDDVVRAKAHAIFGGLAKRRAGTR